MDRGQQFSYADIESAHPDMVDDGLESAVRAFASGTADDPMADFAPNPSAYELKNVPLESIDNYLPYDSNNPRIVRAMEGYKKGHAVPPVVLVHRAGRYDIADGSHRVAAAQHLGLPHVSAYVAESDLQEPHPGFDG